MMDIKVTYMDNSGFIVEAPDLVMVFDYDQDPAHDVVKTLREHPDKPVVFFVSHNHRDHFNTEIFNLGQSHRRVYVLSNDIPTREVHDDMPIEWMSAGDITEDLPGGLKVHAYGSTDAGVSYVVQLPGGFSIFHAGDLNNWHWDRESTPEDARRAEQKYTEILQSIARDHKAFDLAFFPVDVRQGDNCAAGARQLLEAIKVRDFFPMHFKGDYEKACDFASYRLPADIASRTEFHCLHKPGESVEIKH